MKIVCCILFCLSKRDITFQLHYKNKTEVNTEGSCAESITGKASLADVPNSSRSQAVLLGSMKNTDVEGIKGQN